MSPPIPLSPSVNPGHRHAARLLAMVHELHKAGHQRIRFSSGMSPSGIHWRCAITHAGNMTADGLRIRDFHACGEVAAYSSSSGDRYFGWADAPGRCARELGLLFLDRFAGIAGKGLGRDWAYAGWLTEVLGRAERDEPSGFPVFFADYPIDLEPADLPPPVPTGTTRG